MTLKKLQSICCGRLADSDLKISLDSSFEDFYEGFALTTKIYDLPQKLEDYQITVISNISYKSKNIEVVISKNKEHTQEVIKVGELLKILKCIDGRYYDSLKHNRNTALVSSIREYSDDILEKIDISPYKGVGLIFYVIKKTI